MSLCSYIHIKKKFVSPESESYKGYKVLLRCYYVYLDSVFFLFSFAMHPARCDIL